MLAKKSRSTGHGRYLFQNLAKGDLLLPHLTADGRKSVGPGEIFEGNDEFFKMVPSSLSYVKEVSVEKKEVLLTEQPPVYTTQGQVEYALVKEGELEADKKKKLLVEPNNDSIVIAR